MNEMPLLGEIDGEVIVGIEYRRVTRQQWLVPHAVYTVRPENPKWLASIYDFDWCAKAGVVCYHNSGSGGLGLHLGRFINPGKIGQPLWWDPSLIEVGASARTLKRWGYKICRTPQRLQGTDELNPFRIGAIPETKVEYCKHCRSFVPIESDDPCEHLTWNEQHSEFRYSDRAAITP